MRVIVYPHSLSLGGSQLNAVELAGRLRAAGHEVELFGRPGPLVERASELGVDFVASRAPHRRPDLMVARGLHAEIVRFRADVVHGWEWPPILEAVLATPGTQAAAVGSVMSMAVAPFIPRRLPLTVGTSAILEAERGRGRVGAELLEPPIDTESDDPAAVSAIDRAGFRARLGIDPAETLVVVVCRLASSLKLEGLLTATAVVGELARRYPVRLVIVGDGQARARVADAAAAVNAAVGREVVVLAGALKDPRPAYAAADIALGMGGSALRALAFALPLVVQGERGYWRALDASSEAEFRWSGWYGIGSDSEGGHGRLREELLPLVSDAGLRRARGELGRRIATEYSLTSASERLLAVYADAIARRPDRGGTADLARCVAELARYRAHAEWARIARRGRGEDFNTVAKAASAPGAAPRSA
jgi:glycosyltransferase involved in cell wall biosynthesis